MDKPLQWQSGTFDNFCDSIEVYQQRYPDTRKGQAYFNVLCKVRPDIAEQVRGRLLLDPFYQDEKLPAFLSFVRQAW